MPTRDRAKKHQFLLTVQDQKPNEKHPTERLKAVYKSFNDKAKKSGIEHFIALA